MTVCTRCHRPLKQPTETGMGPVCARASRMQPVQAHERDLFGFDIDLACTVATRRIEFFIEKAATEAIAALRNFKERS